MQKKCMRPDKAGGALLPDMSMTRHNFPLHSNSIDRIFVMRSHVGVELIFFS